VALVLLLLEEVVVSVAECKCRSMEWRVMVEIVVGVVDVRWMVTVPEKM